MQGLGWVVVCVATVGLGCSTTEDDDTSSLSGFDSDFSGTSSGSGSPTTDPSTTGDESSGGPTSCFGEMECIPAVPDGWEGPVALGRGQNAPACAGTYPNLAMEANAGLQPAPVSCANCACGDATGLDCVPNDEVQGMPGGIALYGDGNCQQPESSHDLMPVETCTDLTAPLGDSSVWLAVGMLGDDPSCPSSGGEETLDEITWLTSAVMCESAATEGTCSGSDICAPMPPADFEDRACIYRDGDHECPSAYPNRSTFFAGVEDTRACSECSCGPPSGIVCTTQAELYSDAGCGTMQTIIKAGDCNPLLPPGTPQSVIFKIAGIMGSCVAEGGEAEGDVTEIDPVTACCL